MSIRRVRNSKKKGALIKVGFFLYFCFCLIATIWLRAAVVNLKYELGELDRLRADLLIEREMVVAQRASFFSMENVEKVAFNRLGMSDPERENIFFVKRMRPAGAYRTSIK